MAFALIEGVIFPRTFSLYPGRKESELGVNFLPSRRRWRDGGAILTSELGRTMQSTEIARPPSHPLLLRVSCVTPRVHSFRLSRGPAPPVNRSLSLSRQGDRDDARVCFIAPGEITRGG